MPWLNDLTHRLRALVRRRRSEDELDDELRFHLEMETQRLIETGASPAEARRQARLLFGGFEAVKEECRDARGTRLFEDLVRDTREALRGLARAPRFSLAAVASLTIGIGASAVIFSIVDAVVLRPLPYADADRLVTLNEITPEGMLFSSSDLNVIDFRERSQTLDGIAVLAWPPPHFSLTESDEPERLAGAAVTPNFFPTLGVEALHGRTFTPDDVEAGRAPRLAVLSHSAWQSRFGADPDVSGREVVLDGERWTVAGVMPPRFRFTDETDIFVPYLLDPEVERGDHRLLAIARLEEGVTLEEANAEIASVAANMAEEYPENAGWSANVVGFPDWFIGPEVRRTNLLLIGAVGLLLLLACANVTNLLLARASQRGDEIGLRLALGASRPRVLRQLLTESLTLGLVGAAGGVLLAFWTLPALRRLGPETLPRLDEVALDGRALAVTALIAIGSGLLFGLAPAIQATRAGVAAAARDPRAASHRGGRLRDALVVAELALAVILAIGAGLLFQSFRELQAVESGLALENVLVAEIALPQERYPESDEATRQFFDELIERVEAMAGVTSAAAGITNPFVGPSPANKVGREEWTETAVFTPVSWRGVTTGYFRTLGIPMLRGRSFSATERPMETVLSAELADKLWPGEDPLGKKMRWIAPDGPLFEVVGIAADVRDLSIEADPAPTVYLPQTLIGWPSMTLMVRADEDPAQLAGPVRTAVRELDPLLGAPVTSTLTHNRARALAEPRLSLRLMSIFSVVALLLAAVGIYGLISYAAAQRRRELGIRMALGARPGDVSSLVARKGVRLVAAGLVVGLVGALALARTLRGLLYETSPWEPTVLVTVALALAAIALLASWAPAWRAARLDPVRALRDE